MTTSVNHPRLSKTDAASICTFTREYDQYAKEIEERARQLVGEHEISTEAVTPVHLKYCVDYEWIESVLDLGFIDGVTSYNDLNDEKLRAYLTEKAKESTEVVTLDVLDKIVANQLQMNMEDNDARSRIENLFIAYRSLLRRNGLS